MKKFGFKIALSCAALAASAATLATTTFAWYTSNAKVSASNITAGTSDTGASTLQISTMLAQNYGSSIDFSNPAYQGETNNNNLDNGQIDELLVPVQYGNDGNGTFTAANQGTVLRNGQPSIFYSQGAAIAQNQAGDDNNTGVADSGAVVNFSLYFKNPGASAAADLYLNKFSIKNTGDLRATQVAAPTRAGIPSTFSENNYTVDLLRALKIAVWATEIKDGEADATADVVRQVWGVNGYSKGDDSIADGAIGSTGWDAHKYLNDARGFKQTTEDPAETAIDDVEKLTSNYKELKAGTGNLSSAIVIGSIPAVEVLTEAAYTAAGGENYETYKLVADRDVLKVDFFIFVDGWDFACFDAVQGQEFELDLGFALASDATAPDYILAA